MSQNSLSTTFRGGSTSADEATLSNSILGTSGDTTNLASQYSACSHGKLNFVGVDNRSGTSTSISNGVVTVTLNTSVSDGDTVMRNAITSELNAQFGVSSPTQFTNPARQSRHVLSASRNYDRYCVRLCQFMDDHLQ